MSELCPGCQERLDGSRCPLCGVALRAGDYVIVEVISTTDHSRLYRARDTLGREAALKELVFSRIPGASAIEAFEREARLLQAVSHPGIPRFLDRFSTGTGVETRLYIAQELVPGETLLARAARGALREEEVRWIARELLEILAYLHSLSPPVIHRDIKPANLLRRPDGSIALVDFGAARDLTQRTIHDATLVGTFGYMAPEQLGGTVTIRSDLYAAGATLRHLLSGRAPFGAPGGLNDTRDDRTKPVSEGFDAWVERLVALRPERRYASAHDAIKALGTVDQFLTRRRHAALGGSLAALLVFGGIAGLSRQVGQLPSIAPTREQAGKGPARPIVDSAQVAPAEPPAARALIPPKPTPERDPRFPALKMATDPATLPGKTTGADFSVAVHHELDGHLFARAGTPDYYYPPIKDTNWPKQPCPDKSSYAITRWGYRHARPFWTNCTKWPSCDAILTIDRLFETDGQTPCFIPPGYIDFTSSDTGLVTAAHPESIVSPGDGQPSTVTLELPGSVRSGTLRFFSPAGTLAAFFIDFDRRAMTRMKGATALQQ